MHFVSTSDLSWMFSPPVLWFLKDSSCSAFMVDDRKILVAGNSSALV